MNSHDKSVVEAAARDHLQLTQIGANGHKLGQLGSEAQVQSIGPQSPCKR